ncbi:MAG: HAMP domain-containing sensor histidine kinase, partial [Gemmatimonadota bacterium]|nr:HAMP domain-containing sensor histidine kinase [Gemmatimonadota bacterium]
MNRRVAAILVAILFSGVLLSFLVFTRQQAEELRRDARVFEQLSAINIAASAGGMTIEDQNELWSRAAGQVLSQGIARLQIPQVVTDTLGNPQSSAFLPDRIPVGPDGTPDDAALRAYVEELDERRPHFDFGDANMQIHFGEPQFLRRLRWIPWLQAATLMVIVGGGAWLVFTSFRSERERIWSAMARESAHQMGTPLSSLVGWLEVLETVRPPESSAPGEPDVIDEMAADVRRLQKVSRRFELIGRKTKLEPVSVGAIVHQLRRYFRARLPSLGSAGKIEIDVKVGPDAPRVLGNATLLEWAFENLIKNSVDALAPEGGKITISYLGPNARRSVYRVRDTGPGVPPAIQDKL